VLRAELSSVKEKAQSANALKDETELQMAEQMTEYAKVTQEKIQLEHQLASAMVELNAL
jgi:hydrogenase maturation factor